MQRLCKFLFIRVFFSLANWTCIQEILMMLWFIGGTNILHTERHDNQCEIVSWISGGCLRPSYSLRETEKSLNKLFSLNMKFKRIFYCSMQWAFHVFVFAVLLLFVTHLSLLTLYISSDLAKDLKTYSALNLRY